LTNLFDPPVRGAIASRIASLRADSRARWGRMSPHQALCHMGDVFRMALGQTHVTSIRHPFTLPVKLVALYAPVRWPRGLPTLPEVDPCARGTRPQDFDRDRDALTDLLDRFCTAAPDSLQPRHPFLGRMSHRQWGRWGYLHTDHHLRQFGA
jgi:hypothetical protein